MTGTNISRSLLDWVEGGALGRLPLEDDRSVETALALRECLASPRPIAVVERVEVAAKALWWDALEPGRGIDPEVGEAFSDFFSSLGFLYKYKPYGVKIASPFGYSLFDLKPYEGFSFQFHLEPKLEAFHILRPKAGALVYLSSPQEWDTAGRSWAERSLSLRDPAGDISEYAMRPRPGDVATISETGVVHSVLGCFLEEYASTSVDAVERLWDQNSGTKLVLPDAHPNVAELLLAAFRGVPLRYVARTTGGWSETPAADRGSTDVVEIPDHLRGYRTQVSGHAVTEVSPLKDGLSIIVAVDSPVSVSSGEGERHEVSVGGFRVIAPDRYGYVRALESSGAVIAVHQVTRDMISAEWTRNSER